LIRTILGPEELRPTSPVVFSRMPLAEKFCRGTGIELGAAAHNAFGLQGAINVAPWHEDPEHPDRVDWEFYCREQTKLCGRYAVLDLAGECGRIPVHDGSLDYVISSHVIEHEANVIAAFQEWDRVLRVGGIAFWVTPKRDAHPPDREREVTPLSHHIADWLCEQTVDTDPAPRRHHYHVFTLQSMLAIVSWCQENELINWERRAIEPTDSKVGNGFTCVFEKVA
jgi:SAM-dependent methyltransferase